MSSIGDKLRGASGGIGSKLNPSGTTYEQTQRVLSNRAQSSAENTVNDFARRMSVKQEKDTRKQEMNSAFIKQETDKMLEVQKAFDLAQNLREMHQERLLKGANNLSDYVKTLTPEKIEELKSTSAILHPELLEKKSPDARYYALKFASGTNEAVENIADATVALGSNLSKAQNKVLEGITSAGGLLPNKVSEHFKNEAEELQAMKERAYAKDFLPTKSVNEMLGYEYEPSKGQALVGDVLSGVGGMLPTIATNLFVPGAGYAALGLQGAGGGTKQAYEKTGNLGAKEEIYGLLSGLSEIAVEKLSGGIGGLGNGAVDDIASKLIKNGFIRSATGEGIEEAVTTIIDPYLQRLTYDKGAEGAKAAEVLRSALVGALTSMLLQGGPAAVNTVNTSRNTDKSVKKLNKMDSKTLNQLDEINKNLGKGITFSEVANLPEMDKATQKQLKGLENVIPQKNVAPESATTELQNPTQQTNRIEGETAQNGNIAQMVKSDNISQKISNMAIKNEVVDNYGDETYHKLVAEINGKPAGWIEYGVYNGIPHIQIIETKPEYQRQGIAKKLLQELQKEYAGKEIDFGMTTPDGTKLLDKVTYTVENKDVVEKLNRIREIDNIINTYDEQLNYYTDNGLRVPDGYADDYNELIDEKWKLENETYDKEISKRFVKLENVEKTDVAGEKPAFSMPEIPKGHTRLYRGLTQEYNKNYLENHQEIGYNEITRKPEPKNYVYKRITNSDKARISSDYMVNANKYTEDIGSVDFSDVSYIYQKKNNEIEILKKFKGSQEFINSIKGEWSNGTNEMPERNNKVNESVRDERRQSNIANGGTRRTRESGTSNRPDSRLGGQRGDINGEQVGKNNSDGIKDSEKSSFSLPETDNQGRKLTTEQQEFFKDSKVRDDNGSLKVMYHSTNSDFNTFDISKSNEGIYGKGFYFTEDESFSKNYGNRLVKAYLNLKNPLYANYSKEQKTFNDTNIKEFLEEVYKKEKIDLNKYGKWATVDNFANRLNGDSDWYIISQIKQTFGIKPTNLIKISNDLGITSYDGIIAKNETIVFEPNQIKNVDNTSPTEKPDIRYFASSESSRPYMDLDRYTSRDNESKVNKVGLTDIQNAINDIVAVKTGKFRQNAYGIYKTKGEIIRLKQMKDIPVALHELTHHLDKKYNLSSSDKAFNELKKIAVVGKNATNQTIISEGVAEFGRYYMTDKEYAKEIAPSYYDAFEKALDGDPTMKAKVENIRQMVTNYLDQSPLNRLSSNIDYGDEDVSLWQKGKDTIIKTANTFRKNFVDDLDPLKKIVKEISGDKKLMTEEDAYKLLRLNNGVTGKVQVALEYGVLDKKGEKVSKSLKEILEPVANNQKEFVAYLTALRANDLQSRGIESGMLSRDVNDVIKMYKKNETFNKAATELYNFQNKILETTLIDSGIITKDALDAYNKNNPHYVPFYRVMDENFKQSKSSKAKKPTKIKGSTRDIINPLESIIKNTYSYMQMAERNDTFKVLFDMANKYDGTGKWFDKVPTDMMATKVTAEDVKGILEQLNLGDEDVNYNEIFTTLFSPANNQKGNIVTVMQKGKPVHYEIMDKELFDILSPTIKGENFIVKLLSPASKALRVGATHTPEFVVRNPLRDTVDAAIYSKNKFRPVVDSLIGMFNVAGRTDLYYKWLQSGGSGSTYTNAQRPVLQKTLKGLTEGVTQEKGVKKALKGVGNLAKHPLRTYLDVAGAISNVAEEGTRVGEFRRALQQGKTEKEAALDSREITLDFSRGGKHAKDINKVVAFFNAELQGLDKMVTSFKDRPVATFVKSLAYVTLPAIILRALQDEDELEKVPQWEKDEFFVFFVNDTPIKIPKSQGVGQIFGTIPERAIDYLRTHDKDAFDGLAQRLVTSYVPVDSTTSIFPNFFLPLIENTANYSFFKQQPIVNQSLQNRSPKYQYDENTSTLAKTIGGVLNYSPKKIDNIISGYAGNLGKDAANLIGMPIDLLSGNKRDSEYKSLNSKLKKVPLLKGFIASDYASKSLDKFYKSKDEVSTKYTDAKFNVSDGGTTATEKAELKYYKELNSLYNKAYSEIKELDEQIDAVTNGKGSDKYKETKIEQLKDKKDNIADKVEKQKELKGFNVKFNK